MKSINQYIKIQRLQINNSLQNQKIIYLDTNYWIKLRDQSQSRIEMDKILYDRIIELVSTNKCIFPISEITFWEVMKQGNNETLQRSAELIDRFSKGLSIISDKERRHLEFAHFLRKNTGKDVYDLKNLVWTKLPFTVMNDIIPQLESLELAMSFIDFVDNFSFTDIVSIITKSGHSISFSHKDDVDLLNSKKEQHKDENRSFKQMYLSELGGYLELFETSLNETMSYLYYWDNGIFPTEDEIKDTATKPLRNIIYNLAKLNKLTTELPTFRIFPELAAVIRWNKDRKYKDGNDTIDLLHATTALPYYDFFFTERELNSIIRQRGLDKLYNCVVESDSQKILQHLNSFS